MVCWNYDDHKNHQHSRVKPREEIVRPPSLPIATVLAWAFTISVTFAGAAWPETSQVANGDSDCTYAPKARGDMGQTPPDIST